MELQGKAALVVGGSRNIGRAIGVLFAKEGADVALVAHESEAELAAAVDECRQLGRATIPIVADVSREEEAARVVATAGDRFGKIDILVNTAAIRPLAPYLEIAPEQWHRVLSTNLHAMFYLTRAVIPIMAARKAGSIVAIGGMSGRRPGRNNAHIAVGKAGIQALMKAIAVEFGKDGIRANAIIVGAIDTERHHPQWYPKGDPFSHRNIEAEVPLGRRGTPEDVAEAALFLASDRSRYITGDELVCTGGLVM